MFRRSLLAALVTTAVVTIAAAAQSSFVIGGIVVDARGGDPLAKTTVIIEPNFRGESKSVSTITGNDGRFHFDHLKAGKYRMIAQRHGYPEQALDEHEGFSTAVATGPGVESEGITFRMHADAQISGRVLDDQNDPIRSAQVWLFRTSNESGRPATRQAGTASTDDQGMYRFRHKAPGKYLIAVVAAPWYAQHNFGDTPSPLDVTYPLTFFGGATDPAAATPITLAWGDSATADVVLQTVPALRVTVRTAPVEAQPTPAQVQTNYNVMVTRTVFGVQLPSLNHSIRNTPGSTEISGLPPGRYDLAVMTYGPTPTETRRQIDTANDREIDVSKGFHESVKVIGTAQFDDQKPLPAGTSVRMHNIEAEQWFVTNIAAGGQFEFNQKLAPGKYEVDMNGAPALFVKSGGSIEVGAEPVKLNIVVGRGFGQVDGTVTRDGKAQGGIMIVLVPENRKEARFVRDQSDSDGTFTLAGIVPGNYTVIALQNWEERWQDPEVLRKRVAQGRAVRVDPGGKYEVKIECEPRP